MEELGNSKNYEKVVQKFVFFIVSPLESAGFALKVVKVVKVLKVVKPHESREALKVVKVVKVVNLPGEHHTSLR